MPLYEFKRNRQYIDTDPTTTNILEVRTSREKVADQPKPPFSKDLYGLALTVKVWHETCRKEV
jgi:hypothetical protein